MKKTYQRLEFLNEKIYQFSKTIHKKPQMFFMNDNGYTPLPDDSRWEEFPCGKTWGQTPDTHLWFLIRYPKTQFGKGVPTLGVSTGTTDDDWNVHNPQFIAYIDGKTVQALDANHREIFLDGRENKEILLHAYNGLKFSSDIRMQIELFEYDKPSLDLYYAVFVLLKILELSEIKSKMFTFTLNRLKGILGKIDFTLARSEEYYRQIRIANDEVQNGLLPCLKDEFNPTAYAVGTSHLDVAWRWTVNQTREKAQRTAATALEYMRIFPQYKFFGSQALLYRYIKEDAPELFDEIKKRVSEKRWNVGGGTYVEPDCNLPSGESFIRQIFFGKKFYKDEFGVDSKICYIPDSFGFSAALPQIMKKCGLDNFITSKLSWNDTVEFPYDLFTWKGLDGSEVTASFITAIKTAKVMHWGDVYGKEFMQKYTGTNYGAFAEPDYVVGAYENFKQKDKSDDFLFPYGYSDGGGGPTFKHLKCLEVMSKNLRNCGNIRFATLNEFVDKLNENVKDQVLDVWQGELYLQFHRGTLTSMGACKRYNRKAEFALMNLELLYSIDSVYFDGNYPQNRLNAIWEKVLVNQFHDILPGSSIAEQYDITLKEYVEIFDEIKLLNDEVSKRLSEKFAEGYLIFNGNSFVASDYVKVDGEYVYVENVPPKGIKALSLKRTEKKRSFEERKLENEYYEIRFNEKYEIVSLFDKVNQKQVLSNGEVGNRLRAYVDMPHVFDAWEIQEYYKENWYPVDTLLKAEFVSFGGKYGWKIQRRFRNSIIEQLICVYENKEGIYFETTADWNEEHILLKAEFPVCVQADSAKYDIQFGNIERSAHYNTPWNKAEFEVCGHKYADYSDGGYGVALLNDCKYGYDVHNGVMGLSLIKCATDPNERADKGSHTFTYALYPHAGGLYESKTAELAYLLNNPLKVLCRSEGKGGQKEIRFIKTDRENVIVETIKKSESDGAIIIRMYESFGRKTETGITLGKPIKKAFACDMLENTERELSVNGREIRFTIDPFEIVTLKIEKV